MNSQPPNPCQTFVRRSVPGHISPLLWTWVVKLCSWHVPQDVVAHFVYEILYGTEDDGDGDGGGGGAKQDRINLVMKALVSGNREELIAALITFHAADLSWSVWKDLCDWVWNNYPERAQEMLQDLLAEHRSQPFTDLKSAQGHANDWIQRHPRISPRTPK